MRIGLDHENCERVLIIPSPTAGISHAKLSQQSSHSNTLTAQLSPHQHHPAIILALSSPDADMIDSGWAD